MWTEYGDDSGEKFFNVERLGLATYFLAIAYLGFGMNASWKLWRLSKFLSRWNSQRIFHLFIVLHLWVRTIAFGILCFFSISNASVAYPAVVVLYTLPEFLMLSVYALLFFHWLETFIFSHDQFLVPDKAKFHRRWKWIFFGLSCAMYSILVPLYLLLAANRSTQDYLSFIEYYAAGACLLFPMIMGGLWLYWAWLALSGFPFLSLAASLRVKKINQVVWLWTAARLVRGIEFFISIAFSWEESLADTYLSMVVVAVLVVSEFFPLVFVLDWGVIGILLLGEDSLGSYCLLNSDALSFSFRLSGPDRERLLAASSEAAGASSSDTVLPPPAYNALAGGARMTPGSSPRPMRLPSSSPSGRLSDRGGSESLPLLAPLGQSPRLGGNALSRFSVDPSELQLDGDAIADSGFTSLQRAVYHGKVASVRIVRFQSQEIGDDRIMDEMCSNVVRYSAIQHPHVVPFLGVCRLESTLYLVSEFVPGMTLQDVLKRSSKPFFTETIYSISLQIAGALKHIHALSGGHFHGDLRSSNVLLDAGLNVKIADVGIARLKSYAEIMLMERMSSPWTAPEVLQGAPLSSAGDVWSFGIICWELVTRQVPYAGLSMDEVSAALLSRRELPPLPAAVDRVSPVFISMIKDCWEFDPALRPSAAELCDRLKAIN